VLVCSGGITDDMIRFAGLAVCSNTSAGAS